MRVFCYFLLWLASADELITWFTSNGGELLNVDVRYTVMEGRGLFTLKALKKGDVAVRMPTSLTLRAASCLDEKSSRLHQLPDKVIANLRQGHVLVVLCMLELQAQNSPKWMPYINSLPDPSGLPLVLATKEDLNTTFQGSQLLREVSQKMKEVTKLYAELQDYMTDPPLASWCSLEKFISTYADVESHSHSEVVSGETVPAMLPVIDLLNHKSATSNAELRAIKASSFGPATVEVRLSKDLDKGEELYVSYLAHHSERRSSFYRQFAFDDTQLPNDLKLGFSLRPTDPSYEEKKMRFPQHMIEAKKLYAELAYLLPRNKQSDLPQALSFPHYLELSCDRDLKPLDTNVLQFLRFVEAKRVPTEDECPGRPPMCPFLDPDTENLAQRRFQQELLKYRADYADFASPRAGTAGPLLDDERRCLDNFLAQAGAPPPPIVGLYSGCGFLAVLSALALYKAQKALWDPKALKRR